MLVRRFLLVDFLRETAGGRRMNATKQWARAVGAAGPVAPNASTFGAPGTLPVRSVAFLAKQTALSEPQTRGAVMATMTGARCEHCGEHNVRLDENGWCERCWLSLRPAYQLFHDLEALVVQVLDAGMLSAAQLQMAARMSLENVDGTLPGTGFRRESVETDERGVWSMPSSAFDHGGQRRRNRIALLRHGRRLSLEAVAKKIGVTVEEVALWEQDVLPADEHVGAAAAMCDLLGAAPAFVFGLDPREEA